MTAKGAYDPTPRFEPISAEDDPETAERLARNDAREVHRKTPLALRTKAQLEALLASYNTVLADIPEDTRKRLLANIEVSK